MILLEISQLSLTLHASLVAIDLGTKKHLRRGNSTIVSLVITLQ
jgi:hypothetical protein